MPNFAVVTAFRATDKLSPAFNKMGASSERFGRRATGALGRVSMMANSVKRSIMSAFPIVGVAAIGMMVNRSVELASSLQEVQNVVDTTFKGGAAEINNFATNAIRDFGLSELQAKEFTGTLGSMAKASGISGKTLTEMSIKLAGLSGDYASFRNMKPEEAFDKMKSIITGTTQPLRELGLNMTIANLQAFALTQGITKKWKTMSQAEQVMLRYNYVLKNSADAQGDFAKTLDDSYANQKRVLGVMIDQTLAKVMQKTLPMITGLFRDLNTVVASMNTDAIGEGLKMIVEYLPTVIKGFIAYRAALIGVAIWQGAVVAVGWIKYLTEMAPLMKAAIKAQGLWNIALKGTAFWEGVMAVKTGLWTAAQWLLNAALWNNPITWIIMGVVALAAAAYLIYKNWGPISEFFSGLWDGIKEKFWAVIGWITDKWKSFKSFFGFGDSEMTLNQNKNITAPNTAEAAARNQNTNVNINNRNVESEVEVTPQRGATINYATMGAN